MRGGTTYPRDIPALRRLKLRDEQNVWLTIWRAFLSTLDERKQSDRSEAFADGSFALLKRGRCGRENQARERHKVDGGGRRPRCSSGVHLDAASPAEVTLLESTLTMIAVPRAGPGRPRQKPERVIADRGYDSDPLRARLARRNIELIVPHRKNRKKPPTQDGRQLRRYRRRWKVERTFAWFGNFRRLLVKFTAFTSRSCCRRVTRNTPSGSG